MNPASDAPDKEKPIEDAVTRLTALREELRLKIHLAGMDAHDEWEELRPRLLKLESALRRRTGEARVQLHLGVMELRDAWDAVEPRLHYVMDQIRAQDGHRLRELFQTAKEAVRRAIVEDGGSDTSGKDAPQ